MPTLFRTMVAIAALLMLCVGLPARAADLQNTIYLDLPKGRVVIVMRPDLAPNHCARVKELVRRGFYDGLLFHRVITGFMAQTGDPLGTGAGGSGHNINAEFTTKEHFVRGMVGMARAEDPNSADSQFFIMTGEKASLDGQYTIWGQVTSGMEFVDALKAGDADNDGAVEQPDAIVRMAIAADVDKKP